MLGDTGRSGGMGASNATGGDEALGANGFVNMVDPEDMDSERGDAPGARGPSGKLF